jgi:hypothetical protein
VFLRKNESRRFPQPGKNRNWHPLASTRFLLNSDCMDHFSPQILVAVLLAVAATMNAAARLIRATEKKALHAQ